MLSYESVIYSATFSPYKTPIPDLIFMKKNLYTFECKKSTDMKISLESIIDFYKLVLQKHNWKNMKEFTVVRNRSAARSVTRHFPVQGIWRYMKALTLIRNLSAALSATRSFHGQGTWKNMKKFTLRRSPSAAQVATRNSGSQEIWENMKEVIGT